MLLTDDLKGPEGTYPSPFSLILAYRDPNVGKSLSTINAMFPVGKRIPRDGGARPAPIRPHRAFSPAAVSGGYLVVISTVDLSAAI
jgi:hypothetical protein